MDDLNEFEAEQVFRDREGGDAAHCSRARSDMTPCVLAGVTGASYAWASDGRCVGCGRDAAQIRADGEVPSVPEPVCGVGPFPAEPAPGSPAAVAAAAETIRGMSPEPVYCEDCCAHQDSQGRCLCADKPERPAHTPGPWTAAGTCRVTYDDGTQETLRCIASRAAGVHALALTTDTDAELIARAPLLLAENALLKSTLASETSLKEEAQRQRDEMGTVLLAVREFLGFNIGVSDDHDIMRTIEAALKAAGRL